VLCNQTIVSGRPLRRGAEPTDFKTGHLTLLTCTDAPGRKAVRLAFGRRRGASGCLRAADSARPSTTSVLAMRNAADPATGLQGTGSGTFARAAARDPTSCLCERAVGVVRADQQGPVTFLADVFDRLRCATRSARIGSRCPIGLAGVMSEV